MDIYLVNIFFQFISCLFIFLMECFEEQKFAFDDYEYLNYAFLIQLNWLKQIFAEILLQPTTRTCIKPSQKVPSK